VSKQRRVLADVIAGLGVEAPESRIVLHGSVQRGEERRDSDLDLIVIRDRGGDRDIDDSRTHQGVRLSLTCYCAAWLEGSVEVHPYWYWPLYLGEVHRDPDGLARRLQSRLRHYFAAHSPVVRAWIAHRDQYLRGKTETFTRRSHPTWESFFAYLESEVIPRDESR
jgi:hypothetical protein